MGCKCPGFYALYYALLSLTKEFSIIFTQLECRDVYTLANYIKAKGQKVQFNQLHCASLHPLSVLRTCYALCALTRLTRMGIQMDEKHQLMAGKLYVFKRDRSRFWQCSTFIGGRFRRKSTKEESLALAKEFAQDWYLRLKGKSRAGELQTGKRFKQAADQFLLEYEVITAGERSPKYVRTIRLRIPVHLLPFFGTKIYQKSRRDWCRNIASIA